MTSSLLGIFLAGTFTVLSPCVLPVAPILVSGLVAADDTSRWSRLRATLWFALGFSVVFVLLGLGLSVLVNLVRPLRPLLLLGAAAALGLYGLKMTGLIDAGQHLAWMNRSVGATGGSPRRAGRGQALLLGAMFGLTWTPCAGPILGGVLTYVASSDATVASGAIMLLAYAVGVAAPLVLVAVTAEHMMPVLRRLGAHLRTIERGSGVALMALSVLVLFQLPPSVALLGGADSGSDARAGVDRGEAAGVKRVLFFHSEHCPNCRAMARYLPAMREACVAEGWTLSEIDVDRRENARTVEEFGVRVVPTVSLLDEEGHERAHLVGYQSEARLREALVQYVQIACAGPVEPPAESAPSEGPACAVGAAC